MPEIFYEQGDLPIRVYPDGDQWHAVLGSAAGFGDDPIAAVTALWRSLGYHDEPEQDTEGF